MKRCLCRAFGARQQANQLKGPKGAIIRRPDVYLCVINDMTITHFRASIIQGTRGPVAAAAYRHRASMYDVAAARTWDYAGKDDLVHAELALPEGAPAWLVERAGTMSKAAMSELLWNAAADAEQRYDAQTAREITIALPNELSREENIALVRAFIAGEMTSRGFAVDWVYHDKSGNPHVHLMHTLRPLVATGFGRKTERVLDAAGVPVRSADGRLVYRRFMGTPDDFKALRLSWGDYVNRHYAMAGLAVRIDMRSYAARGIDMIPGRHLGPALSALKARGYPSTALDAFAADAVTREALMRANPEIAVDLTAATLATFIRADLAKTVHTFVESRDVFEGVLAAAMASPQLVPLSGADDAAPRYATQQQIAAEARIIEHVRTLDRREHPAPTVLQSARAMTATEAAMAVPGGPAVSLSAQQRDALQALFRPTALTAVVGLAGTGKSTLLAAANRGWRSAGCTVHGAALAGIATRGLQSASGIPSRTVASWLHAWDNGQHRLGRGDVFVLDEAGMVGTADMARIVAEVERAGAKLVVVGDPAQLQPIAAGAPFRAIIETAGHVTLSDIRRQADPAMRAATTAFARGDMATGLKPYLAFGSVRTVETTDDAISEMVEAYVRGMGTAGSQIALAYRNADVNRLNLNIRALLRDTEKLEPDALYRTRDGDLGFTSGDRILFLQTGKIGAVQVDNGSLGTVISAATNALSARLDNGTAVAITPDVYNAVAHGYAATIHKSQGATVDTAQVLVTSLLDRHKAYVAFSRHRHALSIYAPQDQLRGSSLAALLSRSDPHANALGVGDFRERRGIDVAVTDRERAATSIATRRLLVSDAWNRLEDAAAVTFAKGARTVHLRDVVAMRRDLVRIGYLPDVARRFAVRLAHLMVQRLTPRAIASLTTPKGHPMAATIWATLKGAASRGYARLAASPARGPELAPVPGVSEAASQGIKQWHHTTLDADATHYRLTFAYHKDAVRLAAEAGFTFDKVTKTWSLPVDGKIPGDPVGLRTRIEVMLARRQSRMTDMAVAAEPIRAALKAIGVSSSEERIHLKLPPGNEALHPRLSALGGKLIAAQRGAYHAFKPPGREGENAFIEALRYIEERVAAPRPKFERQTVPSPHPGLSITTDGATLEVRAADMPLRNLILADLQPVYRRDRTLVIRLDIQQPGAVTEAFDKLALYYRGLLVPPTSPDNGIAITDAQFAAASVAPAGNLGTVWSSSATLITMIERHFGRLDQIAETPAARSIDPVVLDKIQSLSNRVTEARAVVAQDQTRSIRR
jgi:Ti-type conjugative transfer relaxase TraA